MLSKRSASKHLAEALLDKVEKYPSLCKSCLTEQLCREEKTKTQPNPRGAKAV